MCPEPLHTNPSSSIPAFHFRVKVAVPSAYAQLKHSSASYRVEGSMSHDQLLMQIHMCDEAFQSDYVTSGPGKVCVVEYVHCTRLLMA